MSDPPPSPASPLSNLIQRLIPGIRYPWLLVILGGLFAIDLVVPDPIPFVDEVMLAVLTVLAASWRNRREEPRPPPKDVTPPEDSGETSNGSDLDPRR
jgi:hypothetical protein